MTSSFACAEAVFGMPSAASPSADALYPSICRLLIVIIVPHFLLLHCGRDRNRSLPVMVVKKTLPPARRSPPAELLCEHESRACTRSGARPSGRADKVQ